MENLSKNTMLELHNQLSIVIPAFNEESSIADVVNGLRTQFPTSEIIVVNDGSSDATAEIASSLNCVLATHRVNRGYGASWKTGIRTSTKKYVSFFDGDGQFKPIDLEKALVTMIETRSDLISGARQIGSSSPLARKPGKLILHWLANFLARQPIPDANCGLRIFKRARISQYVDLLPDGFSASMTSLLLFLKLGLVVKFFPIIVSARKGKSSVKQIRDGFGTILLMTRLISLFDPLRIFLPPALAMILFSITYSLYEALSKGLGVPVLGAVLFIGGVLCFFLGIVCDQVSALRLERFGNTLITADD